MAKYTITHICGCIETVNLAGPEKDRKGKAEWMAKKPCYKCQTATKQTSAQAFDVAHDLPALIGTQKQIDWAQTLRFARINDILSIVAAKRTQVAAEKLAEFDARFESVLQLIKARAEATYWIDNRDADTQKIIVEAAKATAK